MNERQAMVILYDNGSTEQLLPITIMFYEQWAEAFRMEANRLKQQVVINPPSEEEEVEDDTT